MQLRDAVNIHIVIFILTTAGLSAGDAHWPFLRRVSTHWPITDAVIQCFFLFQSVKLLQVKWATEVGWVNSITNRLCTLTTTDILVRSYGLSRV